MLDVGSGGAPYRRWLAEGTHYVRLDLDAASRPDVVARAEALPFASGAFDAVLSSQLLGLVDDPRAMGGEISRVLRPGGVAWVTGPAAWPYDSARVEHRFGAPELARLFSGLEVREIVAEGGMLALPFALANVAVREAVRSGERRLGVLGRALRVPAAAWYVATNVAGRTLERLAVRGPLAAFLGYLDRRLPMNFLVVAEKAR